MRNRGQVWVACMLVLSCVIGMIGVFGCGSGGGPAAVSLTRIVFASDVGPGGNFAVYSMAPDGTDVVQLTSLTSNSDQPNWSAEGSRIVFRSDRDGNNEIYEINADGSNLGRYTYRTSDSDNYPVFSPNNLKIAFSSAPNNGSTGEQIWIMDANGTNFQQLTSSAGDSFGPQFSPDGTKIVFTSTRDGNAEIYLMNSDGSNQTRLTNDPSTDRDPAFHPNGNKIAFASGRSGNFEIYTMDLTGGNVARLTNNPAHDLEPSYSKDGSKIVFSRVTPGQIMLMNADGSGETAILTNGANNRNPHFK